jgi:hypothetical protein
LANSGELDPSYGLNANGISAVDVNPIQHFLGDSGRDLLLLPNQKSVQGGVVYQSNGYSTFGLVQRLPSGVVDPAFGSNGIAATDFGPYWDEPSCLIRQPDGKIIALGVSYTQGSLPSATRLAMARRIPPSERVGSLSFPQLTTPMLLILRKVRRGVGGSQVRLPIPLRPSTV